VSSAYVKTPKGVEAIATRSRDLPIRLRPILILIDGKRGLQELQAMANQFGDVPQMVEQLVQGGFAQSVAPAGAPTATATAAAATSTPGNLGPARPESGSAPSQPASLPASVTLGQAKQAASRLLLDLLGPNAEALCLRIETARNRADYIEAVKRAYAMLRELRGAEVADRFGAKIEAGLPPE
jgi:hypothetical protein